MRILPHHQDTGGFFVAVLEKSRILPWQKKPTPLPTPNAEAIHSDTSQELQGELKVMESPDQSAKEETPAELLETPDLTRSQSPLGVTAKEDAAITNETTSTPEGQNPQGDQVVVVKPPTAAAYKM